MIAAVTGGTGFIGGELLRRLIERGETVRLFTRRPPEKLISPRVEVITGDMADLGADRLFPLLDCVDVVYHCAGEVHRVEAMQAVNVDLTSRLVEAACGRIRHWVQVSSVGVYGPVTEGEISEDTILQPVSEYQRTKARAEEIVKRAGDAGGFTYSIIRPSNVYGPGTTNRSLQKLITLIARGLFFYIGPPGASANYIHVDNVVDGLIRCGTLPQARGRTYNISDYCTMEHFVDVIEKAVGRCRGESRLRISKPAANLAACLFGWFPRFPLTRQRIDALTGRAIYSTARIEAELGYGHLVSMENGLRELVEMTLPVGSGNVDERIE